MNLSLTDGMIFFLPVLQTLAGEGRVYKCLFNHKFEEALSERVSAVHVIYDVFYLLSRDNIDLHSYPMGPENSAAFTWASPKYLTQIIVFSDELHSLWEKVFSPTLSVILLLWSRNQINNWSPQSLKVWCDADGGFVSSVPWGVDHQAEADRSGLQGELLTGQSLQVWPEEIPLQRRLQHAPSPRGSSVLPAALSGVGCA